MLFVAVYSKKGNNEKIAAEQRSVYKKEDPIELRAPEERPVFIWQQQIANLESAVVARRLIYSKSNIILASEERGL